MTHRERILSTILCRPTDRIPWVPRLDLWYIAQRARGTLAPNLCDLNTVQLAEALDVACHSLRADFTLPREPQDYVLSGLGFENHPDFPYRVELRGLPVDFKHDNGRYTTAIGTSAGEICWVMETTHQMECEGIYALFPLKFAMTSVDQCDAIGEIFEHLEVLPTPDAYAAYQSRIGEQGLALASGPVAASPIHLLLHNIMPPEAFFLAFNDNPAAFLGLAERMGTCFDRILEALMLSTAEVVFWGSNYDQNLTWPGFFRSHIAPWLKRVSDRCHGVGKLLLTHADGENQKLLPLFPACGLDVAESVCPAPMTRCTLKELRAGMGPATTVWGGLPATAFLPSSMDDASFEAYLRKVFADLDSADRLVLGVSDNVPPDVDWARMARVKQLIQDFGPVNPKQTDTRARDGFSFENAK
jgi:hypothetical protein